MLSLTDTIEVEALPVNVNEGETMEIGEPPSPEKLPALVVVDRRAPLAMVLTGPGSAVILPAKVLIDTGPDTVFIAPGSTRMLPELFVFCTETEAKPLAAATSRLLAALLRVKTPELWTAGPTMP